MVRPLWCGHYGVYNSVWGFYGAGYLRRATIWCNDAKSFLLFGIFGGPYKALIRATKNSKEQKNSSHHIVARHKKKAP